MSEEFAQLVPADAAQEKVRDVFASLDIASETKKDYVRRINLFLQFAKASGLTVNAFLDFKRALADRADISAATKNKYLATARVFLKELNRRGVIPIDITQNVKSFSQSKKHKREGLNQQEVEAIAERLNILPETPKNNRIKAFFCLLALQGLRQIEIARLDVEDLDLASGRAMIRGKGRDDKEPIHLAPETVKTLRTYLRVNKARSGALFKSLGNRKSERLSTMTIQREMGALFQTVGADRTVHGFRHYFITTLLKHMDVRDVRKFSRHRNLEMLIVYDDEVDTKHKADEVFRCFENIKITPSNVA